MGWCVALIITALAFVMRLWRLGTPHEFSFDETYYAKDAWSLWNFGYARSYVEGANEKILDGVTSGIWTDTPSMAVHPDVGKWLIALGEWAFGMDPTGWRVASAIAGALMVLIIIRLVRRMSGSTLVGAIAGVLMAVDGLHFVLSRLALLDIFLALFTLAAVAAMVNDRDWYRAKLAALTPERLDLLNGRTGIAAWGPAIWWRPWLFTSGVMWGLAVGTKWTAMYPMAVFGLAVWLWSAGARRSFGLRGSVWKAAIIDGIPAAIHVVVVAAMVYIASWGGWLANADVYEEHLSSTQYTQFTGKGHCEGESFVADDPDPDARWPTATEPDASGLGEVTQSLRSLWYYHQDVWTFHTRYLECATHPYSSKPAGWLLLNRPVGASAENNIAPGAQGCTADEGSDCLRQVLLLGTPLLWWGGTIALLFAAVMWVAKRDWRFGVAVLGVASSWLPWFQYADRPIFSYYSIVMLPFMIIALSLALGMIIGPRKPAERRLIGAVIAGAFIVAVVANFAYFWPIYTNGLLEHGDWMNRMWFSRWI